MAQQFTKIYDSPREFSMKADDYFAQCDEAKKPYTVAGLAYALGFSRRDTLTQDYAKGENHAAFHDVAKRALLRVERQFEERLMDPKGNPAGPIFWLKAAAGLSDKQPGEQGIVNIILKGTASKL